MNGYELPLSAPPVVRQSRVLVPLRGYLESVGGRVGWQAPNKIVVTLNGSTFKFVAGSATVETDRGPVQMELPAQLINGTTYIHVRFLQDALGATFAFDGEAVHVTKDSAGLVVIKDGPLNVRQSPSTNSPVLHAYPAGTVFEKIQSSGGWTEVYLPRGERGWLSDQYITATTPPPDPDLYAAALSRGYGYVEIAGRCLGQAPSVGGRLYTPVRETVQRLGGTASWENDTAVIRLGGNELVIPSGSTTAQVNGRPVPMDELMWVDGQILIPARAFADSLGLGLRWDAGRQTASLYNPGAGAPAATCNPGTPFQSYIIMDQATGQVIAEHRPGVERQIASTTKLVTALLAVERSTPDSVVTVSKRAAAIGEASLGLVAGERMKLREMLTGMILRSGNDAAAAVGEHVAGSEGAFAWQMSARAQELGAFNTRFYNASGLDDNVRPYSTARDMAVITKHALRYPEFREIVSTKTATIPGPWGVRSITNSNDFTRNYPGATGVKNGWTDYAGHTLVASAYKDGRELIVVALGAGSRSQLYSGTNRLMDSAFQLAKTNWVLQSLN